MKYEVVRYNYSHNEQQDSSGENTVVVVVEAEDGRQFLFVLDEETEFWGTREVLANFEAGEIQ